MSSTPVTYFPPIVFDDELLRSWYGFHLAAMSEPSLWLLSQNEPGRTTYRMLWLPTFDRPVCVRAEKRSEAATLTVLILDGQGGYYPGNVAVREERRLGDTEWNEIGRLTEGAGFWSLPTTGGDMGLDGERFIIEGICNGRYQVVDRWCPRRGEYRILCDYMLDLTGFDFEARARTSGRSRWRNPNG